MVQRREGSEGAVIPFCSGLGKRARERPTQQPRYLTGPVGPPGQRRRRGHSRPEGWGPQQGRQGGGRRGVGTTGRDVAMLAPSSSKSSQPPLDRGPFPHYSPAQVPNSWSCPPPGSPEPSRVYKLAPEERAESHFKGHGLPQASVLSRETRLTSLGPAPLPASPPLSSRAPPLRAHAPSCFLPRERLRVR